MNRRSILFTSFFSLCLLAPAVVGCAVNTSEDTSEETASDSEELTATAHQLVGNHWTHTPAFGGFGRLELKSNGKYRAQVDPAGTAFCITSPCLFPESGAWNAYKQGSALKLRVKPTGAPRRIYTVTKFDASINFTSGIVLERNGKKETLNKLGTNQCLDSNDCKATEECGPKTCLTWCAVNDPTCCGPSTCKPKGPTKKFCGGFAGIQCPAGEECVDDPTDSCDPNNGGADCGGVCVTKTPPPPPPPPPPPSCGGAWLDNNGLCRTPADGVYPDSCCAGKSNPCGPSKCGVGTVCCNPLAGICTPPGGVCAM